MTPSPQPKEKILIVEDETRTVHVLTKQVEKMGYSVAGVAASGEKAIDLAASQKPDLVLMDIVLEGKMDGIEAARTINLSNNLPIVFITGYSDNSTLCRALSTNPSGYLTKPFQSADLSQAIQAALNPGKGNKLRPANGKEEKNRERFWLASLSHDMRTPLHWILSSTDSSLDRLDNPVNPGEDARELKDNLELTRTASNLLLRLVDNILILNKIRTGKIKVKEEAVDLRRALNEMSRLFSQIINPERVRFEVKVDDSLEEKNRMDSLCLKQILLNLIHNAVKNTPKGKITLGARPVSGKRPKEEPPFIKIFVEDNGAGMTPDRLREITDLIRSDSMVPLPTDKGFGLGLLNVTHLARQMGGHLELFSTLRKGTRAELILPRKPC